MREVCKDRIPVRSATSFGGRLYSLSGDHLVRYDADRRLGYNGQTSRPPWSMNEGGRKTQDQVTRKVVA